MKIFSRSKRGIALTSAVLLLLFCPFVLFSTTRLQVQAHPFATPPFLGTAGSFAVLGGSAVTNTGPTVVTGNLGVSPGSAVTGFPPGSVNGTIHSADAVAAQAQSDVTTAYVNAAGQPCDASLTGQNLGGLTLTSGVYCFTSSAQLTGQLTLNGQGNSGSVFIFQIGSALTTASNASVLLINGTQPCNIFWQVGSSATLGTTTNFAGNILALTSITLTTGARSTGNLDARNGAVTLDTNTITLPPCSNMPPPPPGTPTFPAFPPPPGPPTFPASPPPPGPPTFPASPPPSGTPTFPASPTSTLISSRLPNLSIMKTHLDNERNNGNDHQFQVGHKVTYVLLVTNAETAGSINAPNPIVVSDIIPSGERNLQAFGSGWHFTISSTTSPAIITAVFTGPSPVIAGESLPPITITAILTNDAIPNNTDTATVNTPGNIGTSSTATDTVFVEMQQNEAQQNSHQGEHNQHNDNYNNSNNRNGSNRDTGNENNNRSETHSHGNGSTPGIPFTGSAPPSQE